MSRLFLFFSLAVAATALQIEHKRHDVTTTKAAALLGAHQTVPATRNGLPVRRSKTMASSLAELSSKVVHKRRQNPTEEAAAEPPAGELPIDEEGYAADWQNEHRSDPYPEEAKGKQHHPSYALEKAKAVVSTWWWWILVVLGVLVLVGAILYFKSK